MKPNMPLPSRESSSNNQLSALLAITQYLQAYLLCPPQDAAGVNAAPHIDGGVVTAAAQTFVNTCARIDDIVKDKSRWTLEPQDELYKALVESNVANKVFLQTQTAAAASLGRPSYRYRPELILVKNPGGNDSQYFYAAVYGELTSTGAVIGYGATPEEAYVDFDKAFNRQPHEQQVIQQPSAEATAPIKPKRKTKNEVDRKRRQSSPRKQ